MATGTIKTIADRGFGFINPDEGNGDLFFHQSALVGMTIEQLRQGERVVFSVEPDARGRGMRAVNVRRAD